MKTRFSKEVLDIANEISAFYLKKFDWDYQKCNEEIERLKIQNIVIGEDIIEIHLCRPGLLIGKHGENIYALIEHLGCKIHIEEVNCLTDWMMRYDPMDFLDYE